MIHILSFPMKEISRTDDGFRWCFRCRKTRPFVRIVNVPVIDPNRPLEEQTAAYYEPTTEIACTECGLVDGDCFPGTWREW